MQDFALGKLAADAATRLRWQTQKLDEPFDGLQTDFGFAPSAEWECVTGSWESC